MRRVIPLLIFLMTTIPFVSAWNTTFHFQPPPGQLLDGIVLNYTSNCKTWAFGIFDDGRLAQDFAFFVNGSGNLDLQEYLYIESPSNSTLYLESNCGLNVTVQPRYGIYMHPPEIRAFSTRFRLVRVPFKRIGATSFEINVPWKIVAIYLEGSTLYYNGTYVPGLPVRVKVLWENGSAVTKDAEKGWPSWVDVSNEKPSGSIIVELTGERARYVDKVYGYALVPHSEEQQWWLIYNYKEGYYFGDGRPWREILIKLEFRWKGEDFTLASFTTQDEKELTLQVEDGRICIGEFPTKKCSPHRLPKGALKLTIGFQNGDLWVFGNGDEYFSAYTGTEAVALTNLLWGIPKDDRYSVEIHAKDSSYWKPKKRMGMGLTEILSGSALVISLLALYLTRKH